MRCEYCGGSISLEAKECPYCGAPNKHAKEHAEDMQRYHRDFETTRSGVQVAAHKYTGTTVRMIIIAIQVIVILILLVLGGKSYDFRRMWLQSKAERNSEQYMKEMDAYLENEDFIAFMTFCDENYIYTYDTVFEKYIPAERASRYYGYVYQNMMDVQCPPEYHDMEWVLENLVENLDGFYTAIDMNEYTYYEAVDTEANRKALQAMEDKVELMLQSYCGLTIEEAKEFGTLTKARRAIMLEEAVGNDKNETE